jgi:hypothetical protein
VLTLAPWALELQHIEFISFDFRVANTHCKYFFNHIKTGPYLLWQSGNGSDNWCTYLGSLCCAVIFRNNPVCCHSGQGAKASTEAVTVTVILAVTLILLKKLMIGNIVLKVFGIFMLNRVNSVCHHTAQEIKQVYQTSLQMLLLE